MYVSFMQVSVGGFSSVPVQQAHILILLCPLNFVPDMLVMQVYVAAGPISCHATQNR